MFVEGEYNSGIANTTDIPPPSILTRTDVVFQNHLRKSAHAYLNVYSTKISYIYRRHNNINNIIGENILEGNSNRWRGLRQRYPRYTGDKRRV